VGKVASVPAPGPASEAAIGDCGVNGHKACRQRRG
jgi:hypothetical protein